MRLVAILSGKVSEPKTKHYVGLPPELNSGKDQRIVMVAPDLLVIEGSSSGIFLYRYTFAGECVGDTWHTSIDEAKQQAEFEYGGLQIKWERAPDGFKDIANLCLQWKQDKP